MRIFIGYDPREAVSYHVAAHSILRRSSVPVEITPLALCNLGGVFRREREALQSTDFSFTRFLVPHLCGYFGWALYMDSDVLVRADVGELDEMCGLENAYRAVYVVKHEYVPKDSPRDRGPAGVGVKFLGAAQTVYEKKNWSSVMLFNNMRCRSLTSAYVHKASGLELHQFRWCAEDQVGELGPGSTWNHLVGEGGTDPQAKLVHFTRGGPWFPEYRECEFADEWREEFRSMTHPMSEGGAVANGA